jgi:hypothetical protein
MKQFLDLIRRFDPDNPSFPPTEIFNEGWLLRIILDWFSHHQVDGYPLNFHGGSVWFSEALIPSPFLPRYRGDPLGESRTHADGVIGQIDIGRIGKADLDLISDASQFLVLEAKIGSPLSAGTTNAPYYDQAARNVACIAEVLSRCDRRPDDVDALGFYVLAPELKVRQGVFEDVVEAQSIISKVQRRVSAYEGDRDQWYAEWFIPAVENMKIGVLSWEEILERIGREDNQASSSINEFFAHCLEFN